MIFCNDALLACVRAVMFPSARLVPVQANPDTTLTRDRSNILNSRSMTLDLNTLSREDAGLAFAHTRCKPSKQYEAGLTTCSYATQPEFLRIRIRAKQAVFCRGRADLRSGGWRAICLRSRATDAFSMLTLF